MKHEHQHAGKAAHDHGHAPHEHASPSPCGGCACSVLQETAGTGEAPPVGQHAEIWQIPGLDCPVEENEIRQALEGIEGIHSLFFRFSTNSLTIDATEKAKEAAREAIRKAGYRPGATRRAGASGGHEDIPVSRYWKLGIALAIALGMEVLHFFSPRTLPFEILTLGLAVSAILLAGISVYINGIRAILHGRLNINALMAVAVTGACFLGQWSEAAMVMVLFSIAELIEARSIERARGAIRRLLALAPETAERREPDGNWMTVSVTDVRPGQMIRVRPGERIPLDGTVISGYSAVNQMPITGESIPVAKTGGDAVYAGSINESGLLELDVTSPAGDTMLARIIAIVEEAQQVRAPVQRFVDRFAAVYTPAVFVTALIIALLMPLAADWTWSDAFYRSLVLLIIACPCALVIATPITIVSGLTAAARAGILIKGGIYLEEARKIKAVALDKTGTVTEGKPKLIVTEIIAKGIPPEKVRHWAAAMTSLSAHPVSRAIFETFGGNFRPESAGQFTEVPGKGSQAVIDGKRLRLGNVRWIGEETPVAPEVAAQIAAHEKSGYTVTLFAAGGEILALFAVADVIRVNSWIAIEELVCRRIRPVMLTGDNALTAETIASQAGIRDFHANLLPKDKLLAVRSLQSHHEYVAMVGDGINDAPALAAANIGIAMGGAGTDIAMETADVVIMNDDLRKVVDLIRISRRTFRRLQENIGIALGIKLVFFILAFSGYASMWMAVFADVGATLIVVFNGLRLLRWRSRFSAS